jgi:hypothetical protein
MRIDASLEKLINNGVPSADITANYTTMEPNFKG